MINDEALPVLISRVSEGPWNNRLDAVDIITRTHGSLAVPQLIKLLESSCPDTRNAAALALRDIGDDSAVDALFMAIKNTENLANRATLVYALEKLDCRDHFLDIVELVLSDKADVRLAAMNIFYEQGFLVDDDDLEIARSKFDNDPMNADYPEWILSAKKRLTDFA